LIGLQRKSALGGEDKENEGTYAESIEGGKKSIAPVQTGKEFSL